jgi:L-fuconolactonase
MSAAQSIDAHQHFWSLARGDYGWLRPELAPLYRDFLPADLAPLLAASGVHETIAVQAAPTVAETRYLLELAHGTPWIAGVVGWVDLEAPDAPSVIEALATDEKLVGVRPMIQDIADPSWMLRADLAPALRALERSGLTFDALVRPLHLRPLLALLERHPDLQVVVDHAAKPEIAGGAFEPWASELALVARETRACCKLSGLLTEAGSDRGLERLRPWAEHVLASFGAGRVMWGSDWPVVNLAGDYAGWRRTAEALLAPASAAERERVFGGTAARFYGVEKEGP